MQRSLLAITLGLLCVTLTSCPGPGPTPAPDTQPPTVVLNGPTSITGSAHYDVDARDNTGVKQVQLFKAGVLIGTDTVSPFGFDVNFQPSDNGSVTLKAVATDQAGLQASHELQVNVNVGATNYTPAKGYWNEVPAGGPWCSTTRLATLGEQIDLDRTVTPTMRELRGWGGRSLRPQGTRAAPVQFMLPLDQPLEQAEQRFNQALRSLGVSQHEARGWWHTAVVSDLQANQLLRDGTVQYAEPVVRLSLSALPTPTERPLTNESTYLRMTGVPQAWAALDQGCAHPVVAVVDSGWTGDTTGHDSNLVPRSGWFDTITGRQGQATTSYVNGTDQLHGTAVGSIIAMSTNDGSVGTSLSHNLVKVLPINVMSGGEDGREPGSIYSDHVQSAIEYASGSTIVNGTMFTNPHPAQVINLSLGAPSSGQSELQSLKVTAEKALMRGSLIVAAAGNSGVSPAQNYALSELTIGVGAVGTSGVRSSFSNYGPGVDMMAPGSNVAVLIGGQEQLWSGTSFAAPWASAQLALWSYTNQQRTGSFTAGLSGQALHDRVTQCLASAGSPRADEGSGIINTAKLVDQSNPSCHP